MEKENDELKRISEKLDVAIGVLLNLGDSLGTKRLISDKVKYLSMRGLSNKEISRALGISEKYVSKEKSLLNKNKQTGEQDGREEII